MMPDARYWMPDVKTRRLPARLYKINAGVHFAKRVVPATE